jgi:dienelactone hydrolase
VTRFGATGYCYGGKIAVLLAQEDVTSAIVISHPSFVAVPEDLEARTPCLSCTVSNSNVLQKMQERSTNSILINSCEWDEQLSPEKQ